MRNFVKAKQERLDVKCTAWTAGFPIKNNEVVIRSQSEIVEDVEDYFLESGALLNQFYKSGTSSGIEIDYIGPSIDIGFRLSRFSSSRRFVIGVDIPYIRAMPRSDFLR